MKLTSKNISVAVLSALLLVSACGKKNDKSNPPPSATQKSAKPTEGATATKYEGAYRTLVCDNASLREVVFEKDVITVRDLKFSDSKCEMGPPQPLNEWKSKFRLAKKTLDNYGDLIEYLDGSDVWLQENVLLDSNGISFEFEKYVFVKE